MLKFYNFIKALPYVLITFVLVVIFLPDESHLSNNTVVYASYSDVTDWDPASAFSLEILVLGNIYETLVRYDPNSSVNMIKPCLAENWSVSEDGLEWTFQLRKNVLFHDGSELTADSAKYSIERTIHKNKGGSYIWEPVQSIDVIDKYTLKISTKYPAPIDLIASSQYAAYIYSPATKKLGEDWFNQGKASGTGPYKLRQWNRNQQIVIEQNDDYWGEWGENQISRVIFKIVRESATQVQMILSGDADFVSLIPVDILEALNKHEDIQVSFIPSWKNSQFLINTEKEPTNNLYFRKALTHAWDYQSVVEDIYEDSAEVASGIIPMTMWGHSSLEMPEFDLKLAKQYLEKSGVPSDKCSIEISYISTSAAYQYAAELFQNNLRKIGINAELKPGSWGTIWSDAKTEERCPNLISMTWWPTYPTPSDWLIGLFRTEQPTNFNLSKYTNLIYDKYIDEGVKYEATNRAEAINIYKKAQNLLIDDAVAIFYADLKERIIHRNEILNLQANPAYNTIFFYQLRKQN